MDNKRLKQIGHRYSGNSSTIFSVYDCTEKLLKKKYPIYKGIEKNQNAPIFIIGAGRSGNTLLRSILVQKEEISIPPESYVLGKVVRKYKMINWLEWDEIVSVIIRIFQRHQSFYHWDINLNDFYDLAIKIPNEQRSLSKLIDELYKFYIEKHKPNATIWGDKTPLNTFSLKLIIQLFPNAKFLHILRDGRDVAVSYVNSGLYSNLEDACDRWNSSIKTIRNFKKGLNKDQFMQIKYEDLISDPERIVKSVCGFIGVSFEKEMFNFFNNVEGLGDTNLSHHKNLRNPINPLNMGKWKTKLNEQEKSLVIRLCKKELVKCSYI